MCFCVVGDQFKPKQEHLLQKAYGAFYWAINFGSSFSFLVIPWIKDHQNSQHHYAYSWAFGVPGIFMAIATFIFWLGTKHYVRVPPSHATKSAGFLPVFLNAFKNNTEGSVVPVVNLLTTIGLPLIAMVALTYVALKKELTPFACYVGWGALACAELWYVLIVLSSLLGRLNFRRVSGWQPERILQNEISAAKSVGPSCLFSRLFPFFGHCSTRATLPGYCRGKK